MGLKSLLITVAKAEEGYIEEWLDYHLKLGFDKIVIGLNDWEYAPLHKYPADKVELVPLPGITWSPHFMQAEFFTQIKDKQGEGFDIVAGFDVDEFLVPSNPNRFDIFLESAVARPVSFIHWRIFGDNGHTSLPSKEEMSVLKRFTRCGAKIHPNGKSIVSMRCNGKYLKWWNPHFVCMRDTGVTLRDDAYFAELYHFRNKTKAERALRDSRGMKFEKGSFYTSSSPRFDALFASYNQNDIVNTKARDFLYGDV